MATESMTLGSLSFFYKGLNNADKKVVAKFFKLHHKGLQDWLHTVTYIRNVCAHHSRLWNRELAIKPAQRRGENWQAPITPRADRIFYVLLMLRHLLKAICPDDQWHKRANEIITPIAEIPAYRKAMGMPEEWLDPRHISALLHWH